LRSLPHDDQPETCRRSSHIIFFEDKRAYDEFTSGEFEFDEAASAVAITAGVQAKAGT
jgi:hypothetical protein